VAVNGVGLHLPDPGHTVTMKAAIVTQYGAPIQVAEIERPQLAADSVMIEVHASSVNPIDSLIVQGYVQEMLPYELPWTVGYDVSGVVVECGSEVSRFAVSDEVFGRADGMQAGTMAEFAMVKASDLAEKPENITHNEAAGVPLAGLTAWQALFDHGHLEKGQKVLIHAGSGGVGTLAIQIAKHVGAFVATTTSESNRQMVTDLGADLVIDYTTKKFDDELSDYDLVLDMLGGDTLERSFDVVRTGGRVVSIKGEAPEGLADDRGVTFINFFMVPNGEMLGELAELMTEGVVVPSVDSIFSIDDVGAAFDQSDTGHARGKVIVQIR
jgi:NADPH:quinone reductase-like Zn-dependent oxidoreductase